MQKILVGKGILIGTFIGSVAMIGVAKADVTLSVSCSDDVATFAINGLSVDENFTMSVSQDGSSNWQTLGAAPAPAASMTIPVPMQGNEDVSSITSYSTASYRVVSQGLAATAYCS